MMGIYNKSTRAILTLLDVGKDKRFNVGGTGNIFSPDLINPSGILPFTSVRIEPPGRAASSSGCPAGSAGNGKAQGILFFDAPRLIRKCA